MPDAEINYEDAAMWAALILQGVHTVISMAISTPDTKLSGELLMVAEAATAQAHFVLTGSMIDGGNHG